MLSEGGAQRINARMLDALRPTIATLSAAHRYRDSFAVEHQERAAELAVAIGVQLGLGLQRLEVLRLSAIVHDIGKIAVPAEILGKPGPLSDVEYAVVKTHCAIGYDILRHLHAPLPIAEIAYQHHERLDGSGYPRGLSGEGILLEARILAVADMFDAMTSHRAYRSGLPADFVLGELHAKAGRELDADAVEACRYVSLTGSLVRSGIQVVRPASAADANDGT
jgi:HD-GYP domain-containing protein (c-di-GMP phosphodiesterase class II)